MAHEGDVSDFHAGYGPEETYAAGKQEPAFHDATGHGGGGGHGDTNAMYTKGGTKINTTTGRSPGRVTDCICLCIFILYMFFMFGLVILSWDNGSDLQRLTRGSDYAGRLCGVDEGVADKRFLYFCRSSAAMVEGMGSPVNGGIDVERPSCVPQCPRLGDSQQIQCLQKQRVFQEDIDVTGGMAGIVRWNKINASESIVETSPYDTIPLRGKYCVPEDSTLKEQALHGPKMGGLARVLNSLGALRRPWLWLFITVLVCCLAGYIYLFMLKFAAKLMVQFSMMAASFFFTALGVCFFLGGCWGHPDLTVVHLWIVGDITVPGWTFEPLVEDLVDINPLYSVNNRADAAFMSFFVGLFLLFLGIFLGCKMCTLGKRFEEGIDLIETASECMHTIGWLMIQPLLLALAQFFLLLLLTYGFMELITQGRLEADRVFIDNQRYEGLSADYKFDTWRIGWSVFFYLIGAAWAMEVTVSIGQFMIAFCIIAWYFMPKEDKSHIKRPPPKLRLLKEMFQSLTRHFGTICLGAFCIQYARVWRFTVGSIYNFAKSQYIWELKEEKEDEQDFMFAVCHPANVACVSFLRKCLGCCIGVSSPPAAHGGHDAHGHGHGHAAPAQQSGCCSRGLIPSLCDCCGLCQSGESGEHSAELLCCNACCRGDPFITWLRGDEPIKSFFMPFSWRDLTDCTKDVYNDVIIRATDFFPANIRTRQIFGSVPACASIKGSGQMITIVGVAFIPLIGLGAFAGFMQLDCVRDEAGSWYVSDPVMVGYFTALLCMIVAYSYCMVFDHTADTLLYCYAWHKRNDKGSIEKFIPDKLRYIVGWGDLNHDKYPYYGKAPNNMYLSTFVDWKAKGKAKSAAAAGAGEPLDPNTSIFFRDDDGETAGLLGTRGA